MADELSPIMIYYQNLTGSEKYCTALEERFRRSGHTRPLIFREWNCYKDMPERDGDLYTYDGIVMRALQHKGYLKKLPDDLSYGDIFPWVTENSRIRNSTYGIPFMLCTNTLYCRIKDDLNTRRITDLHEYVAIPLRSMIFYYFIQAVLSNHSMHQAMRVMEHLVGLIGGRERLERSGMSDYNGVKRFNSGECRYFLGFTESLKDFRQDSYAAYFADFGNHRSARKQYFLADLVSVGKDVPDEKMQDCLDIIGIMTDEGYFREICTENGQPQYFMPADRQMFRRLAEEDAMYAHFFGLIGSGENEVLQYSRHFYENFYLNSEMLLEFLWNETGWKL